MVKIHFNQASGTVRIQNKVIEMTEMNFKLLAFLYDFKNEVVAREAIKNHLWPDVEMTDDRLEQRLFLLQESLKEHAIKTIIIEYISDELVSLRVKTNPYFVVLIAVFGLLVFSALFKFVVSPLAKSITMVNNRVIFWADIPSTDDAKQQAARSWRQALRSSGMLTYVSDERRTELSIKEQVQQVRAGLVISWTASDEFTDLIQVKIMEPESQQVLLEEILKITPETNLTTYLQARLDQVEMLISSEHLPLADAVIADPAHPVWQELRDIFK